MKYYPSTLFSALFALSLLSACSSTDENSPSHSPINSAYILNAVGYAPIDLQSGGSFDVKMLNAIKASKLEAYKEMAEQIYGVLLTAENTVEGASLMDDKIAGRVKGLVKGAKVLKSYHEGDFYITELQLDIKTLPFLSSAAFSEQDVTVLEVDESVYY